MCVHYGLNVHKQNLFHKSPPYITRDHVKAVYKKAGEDKCIYSRDLSMDRALKKKNNKAA